MDEILEAMEKSQEYKDKIAQAEAELAAAKQKLEEVRAKVAEQEPLLTADIARLEAELKTAEASLPPEIRDPYQRVVKHLGEDALAPLENQYCGGCNQQITAERLQPNHDESARLLQNLRPVVVRDRGEEVGRTKRGADPP